MRAATTYQAGRYALLSELGRGSIGVVYDAHDTALDRRVALKTLREQAPDEVMGLKQEFRSLSGVFHPNLVQLYELVLDRSSPFFTMERVWGHSFVKAHRKDGLVEFDRLSSSIVQLSEGLGCLHDTGKLHCDIKPSNVLVENDGRVVLVDFGLAVDWKPRIRELNGGAAAGTLSYLAPEVLKGQAATPSSDGYAMAVMIYQVLTGQLPFDVKDAFAWSRGPRPPPVSPTVGPAALIEVVMAALTASARERPSVRAFEASVGVESSPGRIRARHARKFYGRKQECIRLTNFVRRPQDGAGGASVMLVEGTSGIGKTALITEVLSEASKTDDVHILRTSCHPGESIPFRAVDGVVDALVRYLSREPSPSLDRLVDVGLVGVLFPAFLSAFRAPKFDRPADPQELRQRAFTAVKDVLASVSNDASVIVWIDDFQWTDEDSVALLRHILEPPAPRIRFILSRWTPDADALDSVDGFVRGLAESGSLETLELSPLDEQTCLEIATDILSTRALPDAQIHSVARDARGSPLVVAEIATALASEPAGLGDGAQTHFEALVAGRLATLSNTSMTLLQALSVVGQPLEEAILRRLCTAASDFDEALRMLRYKNVVRNAARGGQPALDVGHARIRDAVLDSVSDEPRQSIHRQVANALTDLFSDVEPQRLMVHLLEGGERDRGAEMALKAAKDAERALAFNDAARLYGIAIEAGPPNDVPTWQLHEWLGRVLVNAGRGAQGAESLANAVSLIESEQGDGPADALRREAAEQFMRSGVPDKGMALTRDVLRRAGVTYHSSTASALSSLIWHQMKMQRGGLLPPRRSNGPMSAPVRDKLEAMWSAGLGLSLMDLLRAAELGIRHAFAARAAGDVVHQAKSLSTQALLLGWRGGIKNQTQSQRLRVAGERLAREADEPGVIAHALLMQAATAYYEARYAASLELCEQGQRICREECFGATWELANFQIVEGTCLAATGELGRLRRHVKDVLRQAEARGDRYTGVLARIGPLTFAPLAADEPASARTMTEQALAGPFPDNYTWQIYQGAYSLAHVALYEGDMESAWRRLNDVWPKLKRAQMLTFLPTRVEMRHLHARAALAMARSADASERRRLLNFARHAAERIEAEPASWAMPFADTLYAGVALGQGDVMRASLRLVEAAIGFREHGMGLWAAASDLAAGLLSKTDVEGHTAEIQRRGVDAPLRYGRMLIPLP